MSAGRTHRLDGLEPDNLLAFLSLLGLLRVLEEAREWHPRASWTVEEPPLRPRLRLAEDADDDAIAQAAADGLASLVRYHNFEGLSALKLPPAEAARRLQQAADSNHPYSANLWAALVCDAAIRDKPDNEVARTPLCLLETGQTRFLSYLAAVPQQRVPPKRGTGRNKLEVSETECLKEALFAAWKRPDATKSFRWDPHEDVRYALRARAPTDSKETTQHGANRLAAIGLSALTVVPMRRFGSVQLALLGGGREPDGTHTVSWPIWREPISLSTIRALLGHPGLNDPSARAALGVVEYRQARRISSGQYMNVTRAAAT